MISQPQASMKMKSGSIAFISGGTIARLGYFEKLVQPGKFYHLLDGWRRVGQPERKTFLAPVLFYLFVERHQCAQSDAIHGLSVGQINFNRVKVAR